MLLASFRFTHEIQRRSSWTIDRDSRRIVRKIRSTIIVSPLRARVRALLLSVVVAVGPAVLGLLEFLKDAGSLAVASSLGKPSGRLESSVHLSTGRARIEK